MAGDQQLVQVPLAAFVELYVTVLRSKAPECHESRLRVDRELALLPFPDRQKLNLAVAAALRS